MLEKKNDFKIARKSIFMIKRGEMTKAKLKSGDNESGPLVSTSAIARHLIDNLSCAREFDVNKQFSIVDRGRSLFQLRVLEAWHIHFSRPQLCKQKELLFKLQLPH